MRTSSAVLQACCAGLLAALAALSSALAGRAAGLSGVALVAAKAGLYAGYFLVRNWHVGCLDESVARAGRHTGEGSTVLGT